ncbi:MAG: 50S ribosomal protein L17 [Planctomycetes bacterium RBG_13_62_9]|nr:MAG: 50S ribosomal protein L17 [Planctomycetes bacterium RBG_13_62_9]
MRRNLAQSLIEHETISTTIQKAKEVKPFVEKLITLAKRGTLADRRRAISMLTDRNIVAFEDGEPVVKGTVIRKLFSELGGRYKDRTGGYTRIIRLSLRRLGDNGQLVLLQLLGEDEPLKKTKKTSGKKRARRKSGRAATATTQQEPKVDQAAPEAAEAGAEPQAKASETSTESDAGAAEQPK